MTAFSTRLAAWQRDHGRHDLPWQCQDPYRIWLSEVMLQQTQVQTVLAYYPRFIARFPDIATLAAADIDDITALWSGLGYYSRARNLHHAARQVMSEFAGIMPKNRPALETLKGVGRSTAAAIAVFAYGQKEAILDGNVKRVLSRHAGIYGYDKSAEAALWQEAERRLPADANTLRHYTQGLMDFGSLICTRSKPQCPACPVQNDCYAYHHGQTAALPSKKPRATKPEENITFLLLTCGDSVHLQRRPDKGIWRNLWSLPQFPDLAHAEQHAAQWGKIQTHTILAPLRHVFTHCIWHITTLHITLAAPAHGLALFPRTEAIKMGLPAPVRQLLHTRTQQLSLFSPVKK